MTTSKVVDIRAYSFQNQDGLFLDANVWLSVYGNTTWARRGALTYSNAFRDIVRAGSTIYIDVLILSEFINTFARLEQKRLAPGTGSFKSFRKSADFKPVASDISQYAQRILRHCHRIGSGFETVDIVAALSDFALGGKDFNDQMIAGICRSRGLKLVTDDSDFGDAGLEILTANPHLLWP